MKLASWYASTYVFAKKFNMVKKTTVAVRFKKRVLRVEAKAVDAPCEPDVPNSHCARCGKQTLKLIEVVTQQGMWFTEYLWLCYCPKCEHATIFREIEDKDYGDQ